MELYTDGEFKSILLKNKNNLLINSYSNHFI